MESPVVFEFEDAAGEKVGEIWTEFQTPSARLRQAGEMLVLIARRCYQAERDRYVLRCQAKRILYNVKLGLCTEKEALNTLARLVAESGCLFDAD